MSAFRDRIKGLKTVAVNQVVGFSAGNPKTHTEAGRSQLEKSLTNHGYVLPMAVFENEDKKYELIDGHGRMDIIGTADPDGKIKVIVLDVESAAEGRRVLLALQHVTPLDMSKLEDFVSEMIKDGIEAEDIMQDTGFTGSDLEALASAGTEFLNDIPPPTPDAKPSPSVGAVAQADGDETNEGVSKAGLTTEHVQFAVPLTREQNEVVHQAIKLGKNVAQVKVSADALVAICAFYIENNTSR